MTTQFCSLWSKKFLFILGNKRNLSIKKSCRTFGDQKLAEMFTLVVFYVNSSCHQQQLLHLMRRGNHRFLLCEVTHRFLNLSCSSNMAGICILHFKHANCHARHFFLPLLLLDLFFRKIRTALLINAFPLYISNLKKVLGYSLLLI